MTLILDAKEFDHFVKDAPEHVVKHNCIPTKSNDEVLKENLDIYLIKLYIKLCRIFDPRYIKERFALASAQINTGRFDNPEEIKRVEALK